MHFSRDLQTWDTCPKDDEIRAQDSAQYHQYETSNTDDIQKMVRHFVCNKWLQLKTIRQREALGQGKIIFATLQNLLYDFRCILFLRSLLYTCVIVRESCGNESVTSVWWTIKNCCQACARFCWGGPAAACTSASFSTTASRSSIRWSSTSC